MEKFTITVDRKIFTFEKTEYGYYKVTPFDKDTTVKILSDALIDEKKYFISGFGSYNPIPIKELNKDDEKIYPFNIQERCFFALIEPSKGEEIAEQYKNFLKDNEGND